MFFLAVLLLGSCGTSKQVTVQETLTPIALEKPVKDTVEYVVPEKKEAVVIQKDSIVKAPVIKRDHYNIAMVLPFHVDQVPLNYSPFIVDTSIFISQEAQQSLDFYMGFKLGVDDFKKANSKVNIFVLDDAMRPSKVKELLQQRPFPEVDVIIGPSRNFILEPLLDFATKADIPVISPFLEETFPSKGGSHFYSAAPSFSRQVVSLSNYAFHQFPEQRIHILFDPADDSSRIFAEQASKQIQNLSGYIPQMTAVIAADATSDSIWASALHQKAPTSVMMVTSNRETFVKHVLGKLQSYPTPLSILGLDRWSMMKLSETVTHYPHSIVVVDGQQAIPGTPSCKKFIETYTNEFTREPGLAAVMGYDLSVYILSVISNDALKLMPATETLHIQPLMYQYFFLQENPSGNQSQTRWGNTVVPLLKWQGQKFIPVK
jgi:ABC-type branched-subunit amino acid transport system substrate-binding protein